MAPLQFSVVQRTTELLPFSWLWLNANSEKCTIKKKKRNFKSWGKSLMVLKPRPNPTTIDTSCRRPLFTFFFFPLHLYLFLSLFAGKPPNFPIWAHSLLEDLQPLLLCITFPMVENPGKQISLGQPGAGLWEQPLRPPAFLQRGSRCGCPGATDDVQPGIS